MQLSGASPDLPDHTSYPHPDKVVRAELMATEEHAQKQMSEISSLIGAKWKVILLIALDLSLAYGMLCAFRLLIVVSMQAMTEEEKAPWVTKVCVASYRAEVRIWCG